MTSCLRHVPQSIANRFLEKVEQIFTALLKLRRDLTL